MTTNPASRRARRAAVDAAFRSRSGLDRFEQIASRLRLANLRASLGEMAEATKAARGALDGLAALFLQVAVRHAVRQACRQRRGERIRDQRAAACRIALEGMQRRGVIR